MLMKSYPLIRTTSTFQRFLLDRLRQNNLDSDEDPPGGQGFGILSDPTDDETAWKLEDWVSDNKAEFEAMVLNKANPGC